MIIAARTAGTNYSCLVIVLPLLCTDIYIYIYIPAAYIFISNYLIGLYGTVKWGITLPRRGNDHCLRIDGLETLAAPGGVSQLPLYLEATDLVHCKVNQLVMNITLLNAIWIVR